MAVPETKFRLQVMRYRRILLALSLVLVVASVASLLVRGVNLSVDFTGGVAMQVALPEGTEIASVRETLKSAGQEQAIIQAYGEGAILIRYNESSEEVRRAIISALEQKFEKVTTLSIDTVGPVVGGELRRQAMIAISLAILGILLYMAFRFTLRFGIAAVICLVHDSLLMLGIYSFTGREISTSFIAAILTVIGYSLNDTIVVLDRVRENWTKIGELGVFDMIDLSINQTISRTINTSITTLLPVLAMFILGGEVVSNLAFAFLVGIVVGTYSSVCVSTSILAEWHSRSPQKRKSR